MKVERVRSYFNERRTVDHYLKAVANIGLWASEIVVFEEYFRPDDEILDLGCGAGRIAFGLRRRGFSKITGIDLAEEMIEEAKAIASTYGVPEQVFRQGNATELEFREGVFDGVIFGFNGLMQIPGRSNRAAALKEIARVLRPGGVFVFTTLDREDRFYRRVFSDANNFEHDWKRNPNLLEQGDRHFESDHGMTFMHVPTRVEVREELENAGLILVEDRRRSDIAVETPQVREFSEDCRFWVVKKPTR